MLPSEISKHLETFKMQPPSSVNSIRAAETRLGVTFPSDYRVFLLHSNGGEGGIGSWAYLQLLAVEDLSSTNEGYRVREFAPDLVLIGTNLGGTGYALGRRTLAEGFYEVELVSLSDKEAKYVGPTFRDLLNYLAQET